MPLYIHIALRPFDNVVIYYPEEKLQCSRFLGGGGIASRLVSEIHSIDNLINFHQCYQIQLFLSDIGKSRYN
jgi:hypothetical protein